MPETPLPAWSPDWPNESGHYWFYGGSAENAEPALYCIQVNPDTTGGVIRWCGGIPMNRGNGWQGVWQRIPDPELPVGEAK